MQHEYCGTTIERSDDPYCICSWINYECCNLLLMPLINLSNYSGDICQPFLLSCSMSGSSEWGGGVGGTPLGTPLSGLASHVQNSLYVNIYSTWLIVSFTGVFVLIITTIFYQSKMICMHEMYNTPIPITSLSTLICYVFCLPQRTWHHTMDRNIPMMNASK